MTLITLLGLGRSPRKSYSMMVVTMGNFGHGSAQPIIHMTGNKTTCKLRATKNAWIKVVWSLSQADIVSISKSNFTNIIVGDTMCHIT